LRRRHIRHIIRRQWALNLIHGRLECTEAGNCDGGRRLWTLSSQKEEDCGNGDGDCCYPTDGAAHNSAYI